MCARVCVCVCVCVCACVRMSVCTNVCVRGRVRLFAVCFQFLGFQRAACEVNTNVSWHTPNSLAGRFLHLSSETVLFYDATDEH